MKKTADELLVKAQEQAAARHQRLKSGQVRLYTEPTKPGETAHTQSTTHGPSRGQQSGDGNRGEG